MKLVNFIIFTSLISLATVGCTQKTSDEYIAEAKISLSQNKTDDATLALKNALMSDSNNAQARLLLGEIYLNSGQFDIALKEFERAFKSGYALNKTVPLLLKAQFQNEQYHELLNLSFDEEQFVPSERAQILYYQAMAQFAQGKVVAAQQLFAELENNQFDKKYTLLSTAVVQSHKNNFNSALDIVSELINEFPDFTEALQLRASFAATLNQNREAKESLKRYVELVPYDLKNRLFYTSVLVSLGDTEEATKQADALLRVAPEHGYLNQLKGVLEMRAGNFKQANMYAEKAIQNGSATATSRLVAGVSAYRLGNNEQAYGNLSVAVNDLPSGHPAIKLFSIVQMNLGYSQGAMDTLEALNQSDNTDSKLLIESGTLLFKKGDVSRAADVLKMVDTSQVTDSKVLTQLGVLKLALNDKSGIEDFEKVLSDDPAFDKAVHPLALAYLAEGRIDEALELAKSLIQSKSDSVEGYNLIGHILVRANRVTEARQYYENALLIDKNNTNSFLYFGKQALVKKDYQEALNIYKKMATFRPVYLPALSTYYQLERAYGDVDSALKVFKTLYDESQGHLNTSLLYAKVLEIEKKYGDALLIIQNITVSAELPNAYWQLYVDLLNSLNKVEVLASKLQEWVRTDPTNELAWRTLATYNEKSGDYVQALSDVSRGLIAIKGVGTKANSANLRVLEAQYLLNLNKVDKAKVVIKELNKDYEGSHVIDLLEGQLEMLSGNYANAITKLMTNYEVKPSTNTLVLLLKSLVKDNKTDEAIKLVKQHLVSFPDDLNARLYLANLQMRTEPKAAEDEYKHILNSDGNNLVALNNLTNLLNQRGASQEALPWAEKAVNIAPETPAILDTYASTLKGVGQIEKAVDVWLKAYNLSGKNPEIAHQYMKALLEINDPEMAAQVKADAGL